jgi:hypothetical protein
MIDPGIRALFPALLVAHGLHVVEEAWRRFWLVDAVFGMPLFLSLNGLGLLLACSLYVGVVRRRRWAYVVSLVYVAFMALQGIGHNAAWAVTGRYFGGFAGGVTGLAMLGIGVPLWHRLYRALPPTEGGA